MKIINILFLWLLIQHLSAVLCQNLQAKTHPFYQQKDFQHCHSSYQVVCTDKEYFLPCRWYCEGKELENSPDIQIIQTGDQHSLVIVEAFEEDTGRYSCFASNIYGTDSTSAEIYIEGNVRIAAEIGYWNWSYSIKIQLCILYVNCVIDLSQKIHNRESTLVVIINIFIISL